MNPDLSTKQLKARKKPYQKARRRNISLPPALDEMADPLATRLGFSTFSDYVQGRMRKDLGMELR